METGKSLLVINAIVNKENASELQNYLGSVMQVFGKNGGKPVGRYKTTEQLSGTDSPEMIAIVAFPNAQTIKEMIEGNDFKALSEIRARVFKKLNMFISSEL